MKLIKVSDDTHKQIKTQAAAKGMTMIDYMKYLADMDKDK